jgi:two-component system, OmpR family, sensor histidine kinase KdpD
MYSTSSITTLAARADRNWQRYVWDTLLAIIGTLLTTLVLYTFRLYPLIPNISIVYLLVVLILASTRGRYAAILASISASLFFDFFLIPPTFTLTVYRPEEWLALFVFLIDAGLTGQLAVMLRQRIEAARRQERETRILYELVRTTTTPESLEQQLQRLVESLVTVFSSWGIRECALLLPDAQGQLSIYAQAPAESHPSFSNDERAAAQQVLKTAESLGLYDMAQARPSDLGGISRVVIRGTELQGTAHIRLIPLKTGSRVVGVLRLRIQGGPLSYAQEAHLTEEQERVDPRTTFFWTFLDQAISIIELARLHRESLRIEVLQRTDALRAALLSSVSHDLRTPLSSIKAAASSLQQKDIRWDEEAQSSFAATIEREADRLNRLVGNLLDMSRIEGGALKPEKDWYSLNELIRDVLERMQALLKDHPIETILEPELPLLNFDYMEMDQVLTNLVENAVRYTPVNSPITIRIQRQSTSVLLQVADHGPGIPSQDLERIFDKFYRVKQKTPGKNGYPMGTGLGLAVCKGLVEANGGRIWAENHQGAIFFVELPLP